MQQKIRGRGQIRHYANDPQTPHNGHLSLSYIQEMENHLEPLPGERPWQPANQQTSHPTHN